MGKSSAPIGKYEFIDYQDPSAAFMSWDPRSPKVARRVIALMREKAPSINVEHVGSTAIPGCAGKGVIDLMAVYPAGDLEQVSEAADRLGFQRFSNQRDPFPDERPVRIGSIVYDGEEFRIHLHLIPNGSAEIAQQRLFRDRLRADPIAMEVYVEQKRRALFAGAADSTDYNRAKDPFIKEILGRE